MSNRGVLANSIDSGQPLAGVTVSAGLDLSALEARLACASFVVLHAALYSNFAGSAIEQVLRRRFVDAPNASSGELNAAAALTTPALAVKPNECWLIELTPSPDWEAEFARILRPNMLLAEVRALYHSSRDWCQALVAAPGSRIRHATTATLPLYPVLVIDDVLLIGQYAHSQLPAASGLWFTLDTCAMGLPQGTLASWFNTGVPEAQLLQPAAGGVSFAIGRLIDECRTAAFGASEPPGRA